ncbi:hypothetical protein WDU94_000342, partial [Cyamophila willieti]
HESCYICNGFYGPNFNEPVCSTCHLFLYPDDLTQEPDIVLSCIKDDGNDSGNECDCPQERADSIKTPPLSCCSYNNLSAAANNSGFNGGDPSSHNPLGGGGGNNPYQGGGGGRRRGRRRRRQEGEEREDEAESSDSLTSDEELLPPAGAVPGGHYVFNVPAGMGQHPHRPPPDGVNHDAQWRNQRREEGDSSGSELDEGDHHAAGIGGHQQQEEEHLDNQQNQQHSDEPELQRRIEELSSYNKATHILAASNNTQTPSIQSLPPEVLITVFSYLDDLSLCSVSKACTRWFTIIADLIPSDQWRYFVHSRFPLFTSNVKISNWYQVYSRLVDNSPCYACLQHMITPQTSSLQEDTAWRHFRLHKEYNDIKLDPPDGIQAQPLDTKRCHWMATITGPVASPYEGGVFYLYIRIPFSYPMHPPKVKFITRIFHPNVSRHGDVGIDCIQHNWSLALTLNKVLISVQSLLTDPYCLVCMEPIVGELYVTNRTRFDEYARAWTRKYAILDTELN